jgi:sigma-B regulation protein RsbU (phosphoserine phosphatase)
MDTKKILVVDDEKIFALFAKLNLEATGKYSVAVLSDAKDILLQVHSFKPDIILLDMLMPEIGGLDVCEMLSNDPLGASIPIIIVSALHEHGDKLNAYRAGVVYYISKPVKTEDLIKAIDKALELKKLE